MRYKSCFIIISLIALVACGNGDKVGNSDQPVEKAFDKVVMVDDFNFMKNSSTVNITSASIDGNILTLGLAYSGGCATHDFTLYAQKSIGKSLPPKRSLQLFHDNNGDSCREYIEETRSFDISEAGYKKGEFIMLNLQGFEEPIQYTLE